MWHDNISAVDLIGFARFADTIGDLVVMEELLPVTVGLFGDWGSGKSSVLSMIGRALETHERVLTVRFDSWTFEGFDDAKAALMSSIVDGVSTYGSDEKSEGIANRVRALCRRINWVRVAGLAAKGVISLTSPAGLVTGGSMVADVIADATEGKLVKPDAESDLYENVRGLQASFEELLTEAGVGVLVVLIDDLDRCLPESLIGVLEAIKLFLAVPKTAFIIAADERLVKAAVALRYEKAGIAVGAVEGEYLDKLVQIPISLPPMNDMETETFIYSLYAQKRLAAADLEKLLDTVRSNQMKHPFAAPLTFGTVGEALGGDTAVAVAEDFALAERIAPVLGRHLGGNPRLVKRFLNALEVRMTISESQSLALDRSVMAKLMVLERFYPDRFRDVHRWQHDGEGIAVELGQLEEWNKNRDADGPAGLEVWTADGELSSWLESSPSLANTNLAGYFHLARETLGLAGLGVGRRLSAEGQEIIAMLFGGQAQQKLGVEKAGQLSPEEATDVFEVMLVRLRGLLGRSSELKRCLGMAQQRDVLAKRLVAELHNISASSVEPACAPVVGGLIRSCPTVTTVGRELLQDWSIRGKKTLRETSKQMLDDLPEVS